MTAAPSRPAADRTASQQAVTDIAPDPPAHGGSGGEAVSYLRARTREISLSVSEDSVGFGAETFISSLLIR